MPQLEAMTVASVRKKAKIYARIRSWGSLGFIIFAIISGEILDLFGDESYLHLTLFISFCLFLFTLLLRQPKRAQRQQAQSSPIKAQILQPNFMIFFVVGLLLQASFGPFNGFFALFLKDLGYAGYEIGLLIAVGAIAEIFIFIIAGLIFKGFHIHHLFTFILIVTAMRWYFTGHFAEHAWVLVACQISHCLSYGLYHACAMQFINHHFKHDQQNRGQALYIAGVFGIGGALGVYLTGLVWQQGEGATLSFDIATGFVLVAFLLSLLMKPISLGTASKD